MVGQETGIIAGVIVALVLCATVAAGVWAVARERGTRVHEQTWRPGPLRNASIEYAEKTFFTARPVRLVARVDRAYRTQDAVLVLTELKRRRQPRVYLSDVVELSAQRVAIERSMKRRVADAGYVVVERPGTGQRTPIGVKLLSEGQVTALARRYFDLIVGMAAPRKADVLGLCNSCPYAERCKPRVLQRSRPDEPFSR